MFKKIISAISGNSQTAKQPTPAAKQQKPHAKPSSKTNSKAPSKPEPKYNNPKHNKAKQNKPKPPWKLEDFAVPPIEGKTRFHDMNLPNSLMQGIQELGFQYCTPIQAQSLPAALKGRDILGQAQTGTGKSAAFLTAVINRLLTEPLEERFASEPSALIVAPTRELVMQIGKDA